MNNNFSGISMDLFINSFNLTVDGSSIMWLLLITSIFALMATLKNKTEQRLFLSKIILYLGISCWTYQLSLWIGFTQETGFIEQLAGHKSDILNYLLGVISANFIFPFFTAMILLTINFAAFIMHLRIKKV